MYLRKNNIQYSIGLVLAATYLLSVQIDAMGMGMGIEVKCLDQKINMESMFKGSLECAGELMDKADVEALQDPNTSLEKKKEIGKKAHDNMCLRVCQWKKHQHLFTNDGKLDEAKMGEMIDQVFPENARADLKSGLMKCYNEHSAEVLNEKDNCAGYRPFQDCMKKAFMDTCKIDHFELDQMG